MNKQLRKAIAIVIVIAFVSISVKPPAYAQEGIMGLPQPGTMVNLSPSYVPLMITGLTIHPDNPLLMDFIVRTGNSGMNAGQVKKESDRLIKYFLACLTIPENDQWVNLSPYEKDRIIPEDLGQTVLGQDMLAQDYVLKQLTASLIYPGKDLGRSFWNKVYSKTRQLYGSTQIPVNTFNKVWILPDSASVYENKNTVLLVKSHLKVMLDEDYLAMRKHSTALTLASHHDTSSIGANIVRQIILPAIEQEINKGKNFSQLRQIYNSMILAFWFKNNLKQALLNQVYTDKAKVNGVNVDDPTIKEKIYKQYLEAYKKGVFNYIKEEVDQNTQEIVPRKYFSGGLVAPRKAIYHSLTEQEAEQGISGWNTFRVEGETRDVAQNPSPAMRSMKYHTFENAITHQFGQAGLKNLGNFLDSTIGQHFMKMSDAEFDRQFTDIVDHVKNHDIFDNEFISKVKAAEARVGKGGTVNTRGILLSHIIENWGNFRVSYIYSDWVLPGIELSRELKVNAVGKNMHALALAAVARTVNDWRAGKKIETGNAAMVTIERLSPQQIINRFKLAFSDALYFSVLIAKYLSNRIIPVLGKNGIASALLNKEARQRIFGVINGKNLMEDPSNSEEAKQVHLRVLQLKGGLGTNFQRLATLFRLTGREKIADKGTDSYFENVPVEGFDSEGKPKTTYENISVAELKLLYDIYLVRQKEYSDIEVRELVNAESQEAVNEFWKTTYLADKVDDRIKPENKRTYREVFSNDPIKGIKGLHFNPDFIVQGVMPVVDAQTGAYLNDESLRAPGGHGAFVAVTMDDNARNQKDLSVPRITVFTNGDGVNNMLPPAVAGWMVNKKIPIVMVTTTKQLLDLKGGLITLLSNTELPPKIQEKLNHFETLSMEDIAGLQNNLYPYLLEIAQAKAEKQEAIFQKMGITLGEKSAQFFNTNMHAQYHNILDPFLQELRNIVGDEKFYEMIGPDLIVNPKNKKLNGKPVSVIQLEGASGSALLAMNRFVLTTTDPRVIALKQKYGIDRLVYFVNFDEELRSEVFTPEKYTWDHYLYAFTDLFSVDPNTGRLKFTPGPGRQTLPGFDLGPSGTPYEDLEYDINAFGRKLGVKELDYLAIRGEVRLPNAILKGGVFIRNNSNQVVDLTTQLSSFPFENGRLLLSNVFVNIDRDGHITTSPVTNVFDAIGEFEKADKAMKTDVSIDDGNDDWVRSQSASAAMTTVPTAFQDIDQTTGTNGWRTSVDPNGDVTKGNLNLYTVGRMAYAWAEHVKGKLKPGEKVIVGFDNRPNSDVFALLFARVLNAQGIEVVWSSRATSSPAIVRMTNPGRSENIKYGFLVTASHNSPFDNGIKWYTDGVVMPDTEGIPVTAAVKNIKTFPDVPMSTSFDMKAGEFSKVVDSLGVSQQHYEDNFKGLAEALKAYRQNTNVWTIVDQMHGSSGGLVEYLRSLGLEVIQDRTVPMSQMWKQDEFRNRRYNEPGKKEPVPFRPEPKEVFLHERFQEFKAQAPAGSLYFAIDGDADRLAVWIKLADGKIQEVAPNDLGVLYGWMLVNDVMKKEYPATGEPTVFYIDKTQPTTTGMDFLVQYGNSLAKSMGKNVRFELRVTPVGSKNFAPEYQKGNLLIGVEESGHIVIKDFFDDAVGQLHFLLKALSASGRSLNDTIFQAKKEVGESVGVDLNSWVYQRVNPQITPKFTSDFLDPIKAKKPEIALAHLVDALGERGKNIREVRMTTVSPTFETGDVKLLGEYEALRAEGKAPNLKPAEGMILSFNDGSWLMVRVSGTEGLVRVYAEAPSKDDIISMQKAAAQAFDLSIKFDAAMTNTGVNYDDEDVLSKPNSNTDASFWRQAIESTKTDGELNGVSRQIVQNRELTGQEVLKLNRAISLQRNRINRVAALTKSEVEPGGIDLNAKGFNLQSTGQKVNITFDPAMLAQFKRGDFSGVRIQILNVVPVNLMPLLGMREEAPGQIAKV